MSGGDCNIVTFDTEALHSLGARVTRKWVVLFVAGVAYTSECTVCKPGTYSGEGSISCSDCPANTYSGKGAAQCISCKADTEYSGMYCL